MYNVKRMYSDDRPSRVVASGLSLDEAQEWCRQPETSSRTADASTLAAESAFWGWGATGSDVHWFDGYDEVGS